MENVNNIKGLTASTKMVFMCINFPMRKDNTFNLNAYNFDDLYEGLSTSMFLFAFRLHDKDVNENGEPKTPHIHLFINAPKRHQLKYFLYLVSDILNTREELISIKPAESDAGCIQYLIHKRQPDKFHYSKDLIYHNYNKDTFEDLMNQDVITTLTPKELIDLCKNHSKLEILEILGIAKYNLYSKTIDSIIRELSYERTRKYLTNKKNISNNT